VASSPQTLREDYWERVREDLPPVGSVEYKRFVRHAPFFYAALQTVAHADEAPPENEPSVPTCERSPILGAVPGSRDELRPSETAGLPIAFRCGVESVDRAVEMVRGGGDRLTALNAALECEGDRREKVLALLERGAVGHALRLATCGRRSVRLECPELGGGCGFDENYVPIHCDSPLCPDCASRRTGQLIEKWRSAVGRMESPTFMTLTTENVEDPVAGREEIVEAMGKLRRRGIEPEGEVIRETDDGETVRKRWCWSADGGEPAMLWKPKLLENDRHDLAREVEKRYVRYEWKDVTGWNRGRKIPFEALTDGGIYGIDVKQKGPEDFNVHAHVLVDAVYIPQPALSAVWEDITEDPVVDVRRIYDRSGQGIKEALEETVGYAVKPPEFESLEDQVEFVTATKGAPLVHPFGSLHGAADRNVGDLYCARCEVAPAWWNYCGVIEGDHDNMGKGWDVKGDRPPPGSSC